ncbi:MAG: hypothetical protein AMJ53_13300 [Gammaproteobacteria bacterium SG8_11]|nr:MAG: hypothetical protein AMJ53_13300 [Gammaproteobacteria bacterium SG8_11]
MRCFVVIIHKINQLFKPIAQDAKVGKGLLFIKYPKPTAIHFTVAIFETKKMGKNPRFILTSQNCITSIAVTNTGKFPRLLTEW